MTLVLMIWTPRKGISNSWIFTAPLYSGLQVLETPKSVPGVQANCVDSTAAPEAVFAMEIDKLRRWSGSKV